MISKLLSTVKLLASSLFCLLVVIFLTFSAALAKPVDPAVERLVSFIDRLQTIDAEFNQQVEEADGHTPPLSRGRFSAKRPGLFRWDYTEPFEQMILSDGNSVYYYEIDLAQVTKTDAHLLEDTPAAFFVSDKPLSKTFSLTVVEDKIWKLPSVRMVPLKEGTVQEILLTLHPNKDEVLSLTLLDSLGNRSRFTFLKMRYNKAMEADRFQFLLPGGVDLIDDVGNNQTN
ncbi:MAG: outer membrane lipoprotein chaperone LolA [Magnetococcales bacterium]|nr:outer membrane lipoprotein chaperone LolA [Magnetococcales bacterium]